MQFLHAANDVIVYARKHQRETLIVAINNGRAATTLDVPLRPLGVRGAAELRQVFGGRGRLHAASGTLHALTLPPRSGVAYLID
jgi:glucose-6-phosphate-specific signal transduction histidine kinase